MTRWHKVDCATPDVVVDATQTPHCRGCNAVVNIDRIIADHVAHHPPVEIPPDEPVGQMALWWPPSVPYSASHGSNSNIGKKRDDETITVSDVKPLHQPQPPKPSPETPKTSLPPYGSTLSAEEFRLARFDALRDGAGPDHPVHINLEVYLRDDYPEYETVSYTWGGEEDDSTPCRPVFVGPYWDVLLQTRNCWNMLRYLRPSRGIRLVWIDAICINQDDPAERALQVANMRSVYQQCSRVVIYLGADLVATPSTSAIQTRMHPPRHGLHEFDHVMGPSVGGQETTMSLLDIFTRRYFSRVWVIQEVLLSRAAVIPIAGREFWANSLTPIKLEGSRKLESTPLGFSKGWKWESTTVPWMRDLCGGSVHDNTNFFDVLCRTWHSNATDPRDKIFGILGLMDPQGPGSAITAPQEGNRSDSTPITPDYTISTWHAFSGIMAHALINLGITAVLERASGRYAPPNHPSWMPDLYIAETKRTELDGSRQRCRKKAVRFEPTFSTPPYFMTQSVLSLTYLSSQARWERTKFGEAEFVNNGLNDSFNDSLHSQFKLGGSWNQRSVSLPSLYALHSWRAGATVDPSTGDLLLKVAHILQFESFPRKMANLTGNSLDSDTPIISYMVKEGSSSLFISVPETGPSLDQCVKKGKNHLFYLEREDTRDGAPEFLLLFLREVGGAHRRSWHDTSKPRQFKLLLCCPYEDIFLMFQQPTHPDGSAMINRTIHQVNLRHSLYATLVGVLGEVVKSSESPRRFSTRKLSLSGHTSSNTTQMRAEGDIWKHMFPRTRNEFLDLPLGEVLPLGQVILSSERSGAQDADTERAFAAKYLACHTARSPLQDARLVSDMTADNLRVMWMEITVPPSLAEQNFWNKLANPFHPRTVEDMAKSRKIPWEWRCLSSSGADQTEPETAGYPTVPETDNYGLWQGLDEPYDVKFNGETIASSIRTHNVKLKPGEKIIIRARVSEMVAFVKSTHMFKQMQRLHFMFRPPENSSERPPVKVKTWAGLEDETDMILRGPQEGDHFLPERPYRPWPEEIVRDFKADGVYWNIRIS